MVGSRHNGDGGETSLFDGTRVPKDDPRIIALGDVDELDSLLGWCRSESGSGIITSGLEQLQRDLYLLGTELAGGPGAKRKGTDQMIGPREISRLEDWIERARAIAGPVKSLVLPGGTELA
ncbi:MAG: ATP:cob(I)alamin adenosyltransferase, partial [Planctomycetota bacterium]